MQRRPPRKALLGSRAARARSVFAWCKTLGRC